VKAYPRKELYEEMAFIAFHLHFDRDAVMSLEHAERRRWCREVSAINRRLDNAPPNPFELV